MSGTFKVSNFEELQHYGDKRTPPWIKLYNKLLDNYEFGRLPDHTKAHLIAIWLLASRYKNEIPYDAEWIARRINATEPVDLELLHDKGFIVVNQDCSTMLAEREQDAIPDKDVDIEKKYAPSPGASGPIELRKVKNAYPDAFEELWTAYRPIASPNATKADAHRGWERLSAEDRSACLTGLKGYVAWLVAERKRKPDIPAKHLATFISKRGWETIAETASAPGVLTEWVADNDPRWPPLAERWKREKGKSPPRVAGQGGLGWRFPEDWLEKERAA